MRLPGTIAEVEGSPEGPQVGAFFDFDGTLIAGYSATVLAGERFRQREIGFADVGRTIRLGLDYGMGRADFAAFMALTAQGWRGRFDDDLVEMGERLFVQKLADRVYPEARDLVAAHRRRGHTVALTSSATRYQVGAIAAELGIDHVLCTEMEVVAGVLTGELAGPPPWGEGKAEAAQRFAAERGVDLAASYFYADGDEDVALMHLVGHPRPTNPGKRLEQVARRRGWPIQRFSSRGRPSPVTRLRTLAGLASLVPVAAVSAGIGLVRRDRRAAMNAASSVWPNLLFALTGVKVEVDGEEHLARRPAVFVFDHGGAYDAVVAAGVVRTDFDLVHDEIEAKATLAAGRSVVTPTDDWARRAAVAAGVPLVHLELGHADRRWASRDRVIRPGTVRVEARTVLPTSG